MEEGTRFYSNKANTLDYLRSGVPGRISAGEECRGKGKRRPLHPQFYYSLLLLLQHQNQQLNDPFSLSEVQHLHLPRSMPPFSA